MQRRKKCLILLLKVLGLNQAKKQTKYNPKLMDMSLVFSRMVPEHLGAEQIHNSQQL